MQTAADFTNSILKAALAAPKTHAVVTTYASGKVRRHETRSAGSAENHAVGERRKTALAKAAAQPNCRVPR